MTLLDEIISYKKDFVAARKLSKNLNDLKYQCVDLDKSSHFTKNIFEAIKTNKKAFICEIKRASPSMGNINLDLDINEQANIYQSMGANCLSILTDEKYFKSSDKDILTVKSTSNLPILRKDFIIDEYQIYESKLIKADAILLIMSCLSLQQAKEYEAIAEDLGLDILVESHNQQELEQALELNTSLIGINNRNLATLEIDLNVTANLASLIPSDKILISESGISSENDIQFLQKHNAKAFLIGTSLLTGKFNLK